MIVAIVLSAGESSRMGNPKALLPIGGVSFIERIVEGFRATKVGRIVVVLGHRAAQLRKEIVKLPVTIVLNGDYAQGQLSSLNAAIRTLAAQKPPEDVAAILVHLVDHPFVSPALVDQMIERFYASKKLIVVPRYKGRRGHPVLFSSGLFAELLNTPLEQGAKAVVHAHRDETLEIETDYEGVIIDIDTPEEYRRFLGRE